MNRTPCTNIQVNHTSIFQNDICSYKCFIIHNNRYTYGGAICAFCISMHGLVIKPNSTDLKMIIYVQTELAELGLAVCCELAVLEVRGECGKV